MSWNEDVANPLGDLQQRAKNAAAIANDQSLPRSERVLQSLQAFAVVQLTGLPPGICRAVEKHFVAVNQVLAKYHLEEDEDYEQMTESDLQEILNILKNSAARIARGK